MELARFPARHVRNPQARRDASFGEAAPAVLGLEAVEAARREISSWPG